MSVFLALSLQCEENLVTYLGRGSWGNVLAVRWQMGELDRNFMIMHTSSGDELNIMGDRCIAELKQRRKQYISMQLINNQSKLCLKQQQHNKSLYSTTC